MTKERQPMTVPSTIQFAMRFANCAANLGISIGDLGQMVHAARKSEAAYVRDDNKAEQKWGNLVERIAAENGCEVDWPGLWPNVQKKGEPRTNEPLPRYA